MTDTSPDSPFEHTITTPRPLLFSSGAPIGRGGMEIEHTDGTVLTADGDSDDEGSDDAESWNIMDLASFLEFAVSAAHCLETLHKAGTIHREIRPNAFHVNVHSGVVRFAHFGNRSVSLERLGGPSHLVIEAGELPESKQRKVKEAMCYLAPEQTGTAETIAEDHRTDLYALGVLFWTLLVGHGTLPFEGSAMELLHSVVQKRPAPVHEIRRDVPEVVSKIVDKVRYRRYHDYRVND
jgi:serine/threonine protein kinase